MIRGFSGIANGTFRPRGQLLVTSPGLAAGIDSDIPVVVAQDDHRALQGDISRQLSGTEPLD